MVKKKSCSFCVQKCVKEKQSGVKMCKWVIDKSYNHIFVVIESWMKYEQANHIFKGNQTI